MQKKLEEMTLEELWELFPIYLVQHQKHWFSWYEEEKHFLVAKILGDYDFKINHIGSTAIKNIWAKPIIDILVETSLENFDSIKTKLVDNGYICMSESKTRLIFNKGYTNKGYQEKVFHLHLHETNDNDEVYFRDFLQLNPDVASDYEKLKLSLWKQFEHDRDAYTNAKQDFVKKYTDIAKNFFDKR